jgi:hypothetical protein
MQQLQLIIPEPCHENWDKMSPNEQGRFCNSCAKTVVDFSSMTDGQMIDYFTRLKNENVCGRVNTGQLQRPMEKDLTVRSKISFYWKYALAFFLVAGKANQTKAQGLMVRVPTEKSSAEKRVNLFQVVDEQNKPIANASIKFSAGNIIVADSFGFVRLHKDQQKETLTITAVGYEERVIAVKDIVWEIVPLKTAVKELETVVVSTTPDSREVRAWAGGIGYIVEEKQTFIADTLLNISNFFNPTTSVYPNPVAKGGTVNVDLKLPATGMYKFSLIDAAGKLVFSNNYQLAGKKATQQLSLSSAWASGIYFLIISDEKGKRISKEKIVVR